MRPLVWNTLDETVAYLSEVTGESWTRNEVLSAAIEYPISRHRNLTFLKVAMPRNTRFGLYVSDLSIGSLNPFRRKFEVNWQAIRLRQFHVADLLIHGMVELSTARSPDEEGNEDEYIFIEPIGSKHIATLDMVGINRNDLKDLANKIKTGARSILDPPRREIAIAKNTKAGRRGQQHNAILSVITELQFTPLEIPDGGKAKIKEECLKKTNLFTDAGFDHAWRAGLTNKLFKLANAEKYKR